MISLRKKLLAARSEYLRVRFPGDLANVLPPQTRRRLEFPRRLHLFAGLAAAVLLIVMGRELELSHDAFTPPPLSAIRIDMGQWESAAGSFSRDAGLPKKASMVDAMQTFTPPQTSEFLSTVEKPLYDSGNFIVSIGKDLAHHADALFHLM